MIPTPEEQAPSPPHRHFHHPSWEAVFVGTRQYYRNIIWGVVLLFLLALWLLSATDRIGKIEKLIQEVIVPGTTDNRERITRNEKRLDTLEKELEKMIEKSSKK